MFTTLFMNLIAKQIHLPLPYEWRKSVTKKEYIDEMINIFNYNQKFIVKINSLNYGKSRKKSIFDN